MHKSRLQEICQKRMLALPVYSNTREGPDHDPRFSASVVINGEIFESRCLFNSIKEAHNSAAEVAIARFSAITSSDEDPASDSPPPAIKELQTIPYKTQLQQYVQKKNIEVPKYESFREGFSHAPRFKARVKVDGQTYESPEYFTTLREAEHSAARAALLSFQDEPMFYRIALHQLAHKEGLSLPLYRTHCEGESHKPNFTCTVVLDGLSFVGDAAKTKKQAEMNAAKVAWHHVNERINPHSMKVTCGKEKINLEQPKDQTVQSSIIKTEEKNHKNEDSGNDACLAKIIQPADRLSLKYQVKSVFSPNSTINQLEAINDMDQANVNSIATSSLEIKEYHQANGTINVLEQQKEITALKLDVKIKKEKGKTSKVEDYVIAAANTTYHKDFANERSIVTNETADNPNSFDYTDQIDFSNLKLISGNGAVKNELSFKNCSATVNKSSLNKLNAYKANDAIVPNGHTDPLEFSSIKLDFNDKAKQNSNSNALEGIDLDDSKIAFPSLLCNRIGVYPCKPNIVLPVGATLLPFSDDIWVAVSLDAYENEDNQI